MEIGAGCVQLQMRSAEPLGNMVMRTETTTINLNELIPSKNFINTGITLLFYPTPLDGRWGTTDDFEKILPVP